MDPLGGARAVAGADGTGGVDWPAARKAARSLTRPGDLDLDTAAREAYAADIRDARTEIQAEAGVEFDLPPTVEVQNRRHWTDATLSTLESAFEPFANEAGRFPALTVPLNTASIAGSVAYLSRRVMGQYDPRLFDENRSHGLYIVHPNVVSGATELGVDPGRFRRWIAFHEVAHAAEFGMAPWLRDYLAERVLAVISTLSTGSIPRREYGELNRAMTAVEGYAELLMDAAFDDETADLRRKLDERRSGGGPLSKLIARVLGLDIKRAQYERGSAFFEAIVAERGLQAAGHVWTDPTRLPREAELESPERWLERVPPGA
ncbi:MAG: zinc-dependent metalloprotease [Halodesulfurarchaeum sp.]|nr:zinc-dependent metalloprotease [Halodesulfurarchaeum sp.]